MHNAVQDAQCCTVLEAVELRNAIKNDLSKHINPINEIKTLIVLLHEKTPHENPSSSVIINRDSERSHPLFCLFLPRLLPLERTGGIQTHSWEIVKNIKAFLRYFNVE